LIVASLIGSVFGEVRRTNFHLWSRRGNMIIEQNPVKRPNNICAAEVTFRDIS
jgi:hypothetical protein